MHENSDAHFSCSSCPPCGAFQRTSVLGFDWAVELQPFYQPRQGRKFIAWRRQPQESRPDP